MLLTGRSLTMANWGSWYEAVPVEKTPEQLKEMARSLGVSDDQMAAAMKEAHRGVIVKNNVYQVTIFDDGPMIHLSIKRIDRETIHDWRDLQRIKNELVGPENEGVEIYPAESRKVDTANQYHIWVYKDKEYRIPMGFDTGLVDYKSTGGAKQRPEEAP